MDSFLLLVGLAIFCTGAAMYLAHAAQHEPRWVAGSLLMPLMVPLYYRRHWDDLQLAGLLQAAGLAMGLAGGFMILFEEEVPRHFTGRDSVLSSQGPGYSGFVDSDRALLLLARHGSGTQVSGRLSGTAFVPDRVELIDGVLRLRQGHGFVPDLEVAVFLGESAQVPGRLKRVVAPADAQAPEIQMTWQSAGREPVTRVIRGGYRLDLELVPMARGKLGGYVQLTLPDARESYVAGDVEVVTTHLRYRDGEVDRSFDHIDTLDFVAEEYLLTQYRSDDVEEISFEAGVMDVLEGRAETLAKVLLHDGRLGKHVIKAARTEIGWSVLGSETAAATEAAGFQSVYSALPPASLREPRVVKRPSAPVVKERTLSFSELASLVGQGAVVEMTSGRREQGVLRGLDKDKLLLEATKAGGGVIQFRLAQAELAVLRMSSGEVIRLAGAASTAAASVTAEAASQEVVMVGDKDLTRFMNKSVKVVAVDGKTTTGVFRGVRKERLVVEMLVGGGKVDYTIPVGQLASMDFAGR